MRKERPENRARERKTPRRIAFLAFQQVVLLDLAGPWDVFNLANMLSPPSAVPYQLELISGDNEQTIASQAGISLTSHCHAARCRGSIDTLVVPATDPVEKTPPSGKTLLILRRLAGRSRRVVSVCGGAFLLAAAGLLDGKRATTHWLGCRELQARYPSVSVEPDAIFVKDGDVYTSAGVTAGIDLALTLVEEDLGRDMALNCARHLVVFMRRPGGQTQFSATLESQQSQRDPINELIAWATDHPGSDLSVTSMAERVHMSPRNFARVFHEEVGMTPAAFVEKLRVETARRHLEDSDDGLETIAKICGFGSADSMRRSFLRDVKVSPSNYRQRFRS